MYSLIGACLQPKLQHLRKTKLTHVAASRAKTKHSEEALSREECGEKGKSDSDDLFI